MKPINTYKRFFRYLRKARKEHNVVFVILRSNLEIKADNGKRVNAHSVWSPLYMPGGMTAYLSPFQVLHRTFFCRGDVKDWLGSDSAARAMGMSQSKYLELLDAQIEARRHLLSLRRRMLKACGLIEIHNTKRPRYEHHGSTISVDECPF